MNFLKKLVIKWVRDDWNQASKDGVVRPISTYEDARPENEPIISFRIYSASNGKIVEFRKYDRKADRHDNSMYIVEKDADLGEKISKILSLELLK